MKAFNVARATPDGKLTLDSETVLDELMWETNIEIEVATDEMKKMQLCLELAEFSHEVGNYRYALHYYCMILDVALKGWKIVDSHGEIALKAYSGLNDLPYKTSDDYVREVVWNYRESYGDLFQEVRERMAAADGNDADRSEEK